MKFMLKLLFLLVPLTLLRGAGGEAYSQSWQWATRFGSASNGNMYDRISDMKVDNEGNVYVCGIHTSNTIFDTTSVTYYGGAFDIFLAKYDCYGQLVWIRTAGGSSLDIATALVIDNSGYIYFTGRINASFASTVYFGDSTITANTDDLFLAKYDVNGNFIWLQIAAPGSAILNSGGGGIVLDNNNNLVVYGISSNNGPLFPGFNVGAGKYFAVFDTTGAILSVTDFALSNPGWLIKGGMKLDSFNNRFLAGSMWGDSVVIGGQTIYNISNSDGLIVKIAPNGTLVWYQQIASLPNRSCNLNGFDVSNNEVFISGQGDDSLQLGPFMIHNTMGSVYVPFVAKLDASGQYVWAHNVSAIYGWGNGIIAYNDTAFFTGMFRGTGVFGNDTIVPNNIQDGFIAIATSAGISNAIKLDGDGGDYDEGLFVAVDAYRNKYVSGAMASNFHYGSNTITSIGGSYDGYIAKYGTICTTGIEELNTVSNSLFAYPNPAEDILHVKADHLGGNFTVSLINTVGQIVFEQQYKNTYNNEFTISLRQVPAGIYLVQVTDKVKILSSKILKY